MTLSKSSLLACLVTLGVLCSAAFAPVQAQDFVIDKDKYEKHQADLRQAQAQAKKVKKSGHSKGRYRGSSVYSKRTYVRPLQPMNPNLRSGDISQSDQRRLGHSLNN